MTRRALGAALLAVGGVAGCTRPPATGAGGALRTELSGKVMGTTFSIKTDGDPAPAMPAIDALHAVDARFSTYKPDSEISRFNAHRSTEPFACSDEFAAVVARALEVAEKTEGAFDPTIRPLMTLWGFETAADGARTEPTQEQIDAAVARVGWTKLHLDGTSLTKDVADLELDLSAIAKGYGVDRAAQALIDAQVTGFMVDVGGEVRCRGTKPGGVPWRIGIEKPPAHPTERAIEEVVEVHDHAIATSGSYRIWRRYGSRRVHHIFRPDTGRNAENPVVSVSLRATTCALADALATSFMVRGPTGAEAVLDRFDDDNLGALFLLHNGNGNVTQHPARW
ncbi:MAG: FAD:protein FMN transferase [Planctomycetota bacterium]